MDQAIYKAAYGAAFAKLQIDWMRRQTVPTPTEALLVSWAASARVIAQNAAEVHAEMFQAPDESEARDD